MPMAKSAGDRRNEASDEKRIRQAAEAKRLRDLVFTTRLFTGHKVKLSDIKVEG